jgi:3-phosphoinositide dependent protein kinase-1
VCYAKVVLGQEKATNREVAVKIIDKNHIKKEKKVQYAVTEKNILSKCNNPFIIKLYATFHDDVNLCSLPSFHSPSIFAWRDFHHSMY